MCRQNLFCGRDGRRDGAEAPQAGGVVVREVSCKSLLNRTAISNYSLNCYTGCAYACIYCYARFMQRFHPHAEPWGKFVDVKANAVEVLERQLRRAKPGDVFVSSACDGWQPAEAERRLTRRCCELLLEHGFQVNVLTKSSLVLCDMDVFAGQRARIGVTVTTLDERLQRLWEPRAARVTERFRVIQEARRAGLKTAVMLGPLLPFLSDSRDEIHELFQRAAELQIDVIWTDALNPRPRVWPSVARLLEERFPTLRERYRRILFDRRARAAYLAQLRERIMLAAEETATADRLAGCP
jgi:DNA repair photolyase